MISSIPSDSNVSGISSIYVSVPFSNINIQRVFVAQPNNHYLYYFDYSGNNLNGLTVGIVDLSFNPYRVYSF